jgi:hypothetical protein
MKPVRGPVKRSAWTNWSNGARLCEPQPDDHLNAAAYLKAVCLMKPLRVTDPRSVNSPPA